MKKEDYTHVRVSKELHGVLKKEADISVLLKRIQSIEDLIAGESNVNIGGGTGISFQKGLNCEKAMLRRGFEPRSWAREARMLGRTTPAEHQIKLSFKKKV
jgi:hypothetical protein